MSVSNDQPVIVFEARVFCGEGFRQGRCTCGWKGEERTGADMEMEAAMDAAGHQQSHNQTIDPEYVYVLREYWAEAGDARPFEADWHSLPFS